MSSTDKLSFNDLEELDDDFIKDIPWAVTMLEKIRHLTKRMVLHWIKAAIEIDPSEENNKFYVQTFFNTTEAILADLVTDMKALAEKQTEKVVNYLTKIEELEKKLNLNESDIAGENTKLSLKELQKIMKIQIDKYEKISEERKKKVDLLKNEHALLVEKLGTPLVNISDTLSATKIENFQEEIIVLKEEYVNREKKYLAIKKNIKEIFEETGLRPDEKLEEFLSIENPSKLSDDVMLNAENCYEKTIKLKNELSKKIQDLKVKLEDLWTVLSFSMEEKKIFLNSVSSISQNSARLISEEINKLENIKSKEMCNIIQNLKKKLEEYWDLCYCSSDVKNACSFFYSINYNDELLENFSKEVNKWKCYYEENKEIFQKIETYKTMKNSLHELDLNSGGSYQNRGAKLLMECRQRNILITRIKKIESSLIQLCQDYLKKTGTPFLIFGATVETFMQHQQPQQKKKQDLAPAKVNLAPKASLRCSAGNTPNRPRIQMKIPRSESQVKKINKKISPRKSALPKFKLNQNRCRQLSKNLWDLSKINPAKKPETDEEWTSDYTEFEKEVKHGGRPRSTSYFAAKDECEDED